MLRAVPRHQCVDRRAQRIRAQIQSRCQKPRRTSHHYRLRSQHTVAVSAADMSAILDARIEDVAEKAIHVAVQHLVAHLVRRLTRSGIGLLCKPATRPAAMLDRFMNFGVRRLQERRVEPVGCNIILIQVTTHEAPPRYQ